MLFSALFGRGVLTMLSPDPGYQAWVEDEGLDGATDFHIADNPFMYTSGWDFVGVRCFLSFKFDVSICRSKILTST